MQVTKQIFKRIPFSKIAKKCLIWGKIPLTVATYGINLPFKLLVLRVSRIENETFSLWGLCFLCCRWNIYRSALIIRKLPCPQKPMVTRLLFIKLSISRYLPVSSANIFLRFAFCFLVFWCNYWSNNFDWLKRQSLPLYQ